MPSLSAHLFFAKLVQGTSHPRRCNHCHEYMFVHPITQFQRAQLLTTRTGGIFHDAGKQCTYAPRSGPSDHRNSDVFENPEIFDPERYIKSEYGIKDGASPDGLRDTLPFGAGRVS